jgi:hypothetical protein
MSFNTTRKGTYEESSLDQYLKEISAYPLLNREDEVDLANRSATATRRPSTSSSAPTSASSSPSPRSTRTRASRSAT